MTTSKRRGGLIVPIVGGLLVALLVVPTYVAVENGDGAICFTQSGCPLSGINPCVRKPSFAVVGRCAIPIK